MCYLSRALVILLEKVVLFHPVLGWESRFLSLAFGRISHSTPSWTPPSTIALVFKIYKALLPRIRDLFLSFLNPDLSTSEGLSATRSPTVIRVPYFPLCCHEPLDMTNTRRRVHYMLSRVDLTRGRVRGLLCLRLSLWRFHHSSVLLRPRVDRRPMSHRLVSLNFYFYFVIF